MVSRKVAKSEVDPKSFELGLEELDGMIQKLESGRLPLNESLELYRRGSELLVFCQKQLQAAEGQMKVLEGELLQSFSIENI